MWKDWVDLKSIEWKLLSENTPDVTQIRPELCEQYRKSRKEGGLWRWSNLDLESGTHLYQQLQDLRQVTWPLGIAVSGLRPPWIQIPGCDFMTLVILGKLLNDMSQFPQLWSGGDNSTPLIGLSRTWVLRQSLIHGSSQWLPASSTHLVEHLILARHVIW